MEIPYKVVWLGFLSRAVGLCQKAASKSDIGGITVLFIDLEFTMEIYIGQCIQKGVPDVCSPLGRLACLHVMMTPKKEQILQNDIRSASVVHNVQ